MLNYYNKDAFARLKRERKTSPYGFKYGFVTGLFKEDVYKELVRTFPDVSKFTLVDKQSGGGHKRFYVGPHYGTGTNWGSTRHLADLPEIWKEVLQETASPELIELVKDATGVDCNSIDHFGFTYGKGGCMQGAHIDGAVRADDPAPIHGKIACLMYFNEKPGGLAGTEIYDRDRKTVVFAVPDLRNSFFYFEQHPDTWHGFPVVPEGADRRLVSLSYSLEKKPVVLTDSFFHPTYLRSFVKGIAKKILKK